MYIRKSPQQIQSEIQLARDTTSGVNKNLEGDLFQGRYEPMKSLSIEEQSQQFDRGQKLRSQKVSDGLNSDPDFLKSQANRALISTLGSKRLSSILNPEQMNEFRQAQARQARLQAYDSAKQYKRNLY
jgi:hypothetical protein